MIVNANVRWAPAPYGGMPGPAPRMRRAPNHRNPGRPQGPPAALPRSLRCWSRRHTSRWKSAATDVTLRRLAVSQHYACPPVRLNADDHLTADNGVARIPLPRARAMNRPPLPSALCSLAADHLSRRKFESATTLDDHGGRCPRHVVPASPERMADRGRARVSAGNSRLACRGAEARVPGGS